MAKLANIKARQSVSITIRALKGDLSTDSLDNASSLQALIESSVKVGAIKSFQEDVTRGTTKRHELDADIAGEIVERVPGLPERVLRVSRVVLYKSDVFAAFGFTDINDIMDQDTPFVVVKVERSPTGSNLPTRTTLFTGCWFHNSPKSYSTDGDLMVLEDLEIGVTRKVIA